MNASRQVSFAGRQFSNDQEKRPNLGSPNAPNGSPFQTLDWTPRTYRSGAIAPQFPLSISRRSTRSEGRECSRTLSPSPRAQSWTTKSMQGAAHDPIDLLGNDPGDEAEEAKTEGSNRKRRPDGSVSNTSFLRHGSGLRRQSILLDEEEDVDKAGEERPAALARSMKRLPTADDELIDLEAFEEDLIQMDNELLQQIEDLDLARPGGSRRGSKQVKIEPRNVPIRLPHIKEEKVQHLGTTLKRGKTVELKDGDFLTIKDIVVNTETNAVILRGYQLQRTKDMNGMLEMKMNECVLFLEVDIDDNRDPLEQAVLEVPLTDVVRVRNVRKTNARFPLNRNVDPSEFPTRDEVFEKGGLTNRWVYVCKYVDATYRYHNIFKERSLERLEPAQCTKGYSVSDEARRFAWRGETIPGGAYQPGLAGDNAVAFPESRNESIVTIESSEEEDNFVLVHTPSRGDFSSSRKDFQSSREERATGPNITKRKHSVAAFSFPGVLNGYEQAQKRARQMEGEYVKRTREGMSRMSLRPNERRTPSVNSKAVNFSSSLPQTIDLTMSDLTKPPNSGAVHIGSQAPYHRTVRTAGQKLTYGDGFSGAGGATRGAFMAGLRPLWGFDFWKQACKTWEANFPDARCFHKSADEFVDFGRRFPRLVKVDILHLSPPCQFFSPAHTIDGVDDEMNTASLFAVRAVIEASKPRIVTLEQTFGITHMRFKFYFNALIQMFTALDFSVRWAIIPLAEWVCLFSYRSP